MVSCAFNPAQFPHQGTPRRSDLCDVDIQRSGHRVVECLESRALDLRASAALVAFTDKTPQRELGRFIGHWEGSHVHVCRGAGVCISASQNTRPRSVSLYNRGVGASRAGSR